MTTAAGSKIGKPDTPNTLFLLFRRKLRFDSTWRQIMLTRLISHTYKGRRVDSKLLSRIPGERAEFQ